MVVIMLAMCFWHVSGCSLKNYAERKQLHCQVGNIYIYIFFFPWILEFLDLLLNSPWIWCLLWYKNSKDVLYNELKGCKSQHHCLSFQIDLETQRLFAKTVLFGSVFHLHLCSIKWECCILVQEMLLKGSWKPCWLKSKIWRKRLWWCFCVSFVQRNIYCFVIKI